MIRRSSRDLELFGIVLSDSLIQFVAIVVLAALILATSFRIESVTKSNEDTHQPGKLCAELVWDGDIDLDLWGRGPDGQPVGYSIMHSQSLDLFKDVLGKSNNPTGIMQEIMCSLNVPPGEYRFNVHYFSNHGDKDHPEVTATMVITDQIRATDGKSYIYKKVLRGKSTLTYTSDTHSDPRTEKTFFDFVIDKNGKIVESSINSLNDPIRNTGDRHD